MESFDLSRRILSVAAVALLAGCGGLQPPIGGPATGQGRAVIEPSAARDGSWMRPDAKGQSLIYVALPYEGLVNVYTFPGGHLVGQITSAMFPNAVCADKAGNVWISDGVSDYYAHLNEYVHGGTTPIRTLNDKGGNPSACSVDPVTGNLAVANGCCYSSLVDVEIYPHAKGDPALYYPKDLGSIEAVAYDSTGDLFVSGILHVYAAGTDWFRSGGTGFTVFKLKHPHTYPHAGIFWDGNALTEVAHPDLIHRYAIVGGKAKYIGSMTLNVDDAWAFTLERSNLAATSNDYSSSPGVVYVFKYPAGGDPIHTIKLPGGPGKIAISGVQN